MLTCCFHRVGSICRCYDHINRSCSCRTHSIDHRRVRRSAPFHSIETCARLALRDCLWMFFAYKKMLGRTETRTRDRMYCQTIRTVRDISRNDRARIATYSLRTPTDRQTDLGRIIVEMMIKEGQLFQTSDVIYSLMAKFTCDGHWNDYMWLLT